MPGDEWPEAWLVQRGTECIDALGAVFQIDVESLKEFLEYGLQAGKHKEFYEIAKHLGMERAICLQTFVMTVCNSFPEDFKHLEAHVEKVLIDAG